jgi:hypothetical protein
VCITLRGIAVLTPVLLVLAGCAGGKADVTGKVTHQGKTVTWGTVIVQGPDGAPVTGAIQPDGTYSVQGVATGKVLIGVISRDPGVRAGPANRGGFKSQHGDQPPPPPPDIDRSKWFPLPAKYETPETSGITTTLHSGANQYDVDLP